MGTENPGSNTNQDRNQGTGQAGQGGDQNQDRSQNFDRQQNQQGGKTGQTDPNRDRQSGNTDIDSDDDNMGVTVNPGQQR